MRAISEKRFDSEDIINFARFYMPENIQPMVIWYYMIVPKNCIKWRNKECRM